MVNLKIHRFGGSINPDNNAIQLFVSGELSLEVEGHILSKIIEVAIPPESESAIYDLCYQLQPLVYEFCQREFLGDGSNNLQ